MKYSEVQRLGRDFEVLKGIVRESKIVNTYFNMELNKIEKILTREIKLIDDSVSADLKEIEKKAFEIANEKLVDMTEEEKTNLNNVFMIGYKELTEADKEKHAVLYAEYIKFLEMESDIKVNNINMSLCPNVELNYDAVAILSNFIQ